VVVVGVGSQEEDEGIMVGEGDKLERVSEV
jgi:hypothetical protein